MSDLIVSSVAVEIQSERTRQTTKEGWTLDHDDDHCLGELGLAAAAYLLHVAHRDDAARVAWPWARGWWKPKDPRRDLIRAGALVIAEIERLDRAEAALRAILPHLSPESHKLIEEELKP